MLQDVKKHKVAYSLLAILATVFLGLIYTFRSTPYILMLVTFSFGLLYFVWGVVHHLIEHNLSGRIMLEYGLVTALGLIIMSTLLL